ncbi:UbiA prenyltransferase family-domain-containing protein [Vararia minispora EC-137]|uniref:UbiA prenyltransferase family-domain-containing protein n=1 Tax=Vararia minispora EC-137 TaxID=1314806 RepID=A0ACB8QSW5_9AGAM|nr:UbiA prenyltransferase family-domain-containing protein [Vararia minispora EC-137]
MSARTPLLSSSSDSTFKDIDTKRPTFATFCWYYFELTRLHKFPLGNLLLIWPSVWSLTMAAYKAHLDPHDLLVWTALFAIGSTLVHSAACVINDIYLTVTLERTKNRPLAAGVIPLAGAWALLLVLLAVCLAMIHMVNPVAAVVGLIGIFPFHALYPLMKRWTWWPQAWLGFAMNWGIPMAWLSVIPAYRKEDVQIIVILLFGAVCWTIVYDTQYGCQDKVDDERAGVKSTSLLFGKHVRIILAGFASVFIGCLVTAGVLNRQSWPYYLLSCGGASMHFVWQFATWDADEPSDCGAKFKANHDLGYFVYAGILLDYLLRTYN